jgi:hypothetical protein
MSIKYLTSALLLAMLATSIQAETINCTAITSLPVTITAQGVYCLTGNLATSQSSGVAITINANNVTIDLNGWKVGGQGAGASTQATGIYSTANNVTIKNGIVRGFYYGINLTGSGAVVQDMLTDANTFVGIDVNGLGALVEHNQVVNTGGSTAAANVDAIGIFVAGPDSNVNNNMISGLTHMGNGSEYGIFVLGSGTESTVRNNVISNTSVTTMNSYGISASSSIVLNNTLSNFEYGVYSNGGIYAYNTVNDCATPYSGGTAGAGNSP